MGAQCFYGAMQPDNGDVHLIPTAHRFRAKRNQWIPVDLVALIVDDRGWVAVCHCLHLKVPL